MLSFKKVCSLGLATALVATGLMATTAQAADTGNKTLDSDATFNVKDDGSLSLDTAPSFAFGEATTLQMTTGATLGLTNTDSNQLKITDTRGLGAGKWSLVASLSKNFASGDTTLSNATLNLATVVGTNSNTGYTQTEAPSLKGATDDAEAASSTVISTNAAFGGTSTYDYTKTSSSDKGPAASLVLPASSSFTAGDYKGTVTWTLAAAD